MVAQAINADRKVEGVSVPRESPMARPANHDPSAIVVVSPSFDPELEPETENPEPVSDPWSDPEPPETE